MATLGPATDHPEILKNMILAGMDIARLNMSHGTQELHANRIQDLQNIAKNLNKKVEILIDLQGPKIRIGKFVNQKIFLAKNAKFILDPNLDPNLGNEQAVFISYKNLYQDLQPNNILLLDDGKVELLVESINNNKIICVATKEIILRNNLGVNLKGGDLSLNSLTNKDREDMLFAVGFNIDSFALSFVKTQEDLIRAKQIISGFNVNKKINIIAKIETRSAILNIEDIVKVADGVMVARGDLGVELGLFKLPILQKQIIKIAKSFNKPATVITQMMDSMIEHPMPFRAEVMDVANAVLDGAKVVGFSAETATGNYPDLVIKYVNDICIEVEKSI